MAILDSVLAHFSRSFLDIFGAGVVNAISVQLVSLRFSAMSSSWLPTPRVRLAPCFGRWF